MPVKRIPPKEAQALVAQGWTYVDVRSIPEYEAGHPVGAWNLPLMHFFPERGGMAPNPEFGPVFARLFPDKDAKVVVGCKTAGRSLRAAEFLAAQGYTQVVDMRGGFEGEPDVPGWKAAGLPVETASHGKGWEELKK
jgi:rhodanese-related sulfurtransferase